MNGPEGNSRNTVFSREASLPRLLAARAQQIPQRVAIEFEKQSLTYEQLEQRSNQLARLLQQKGVGRDVLVGLLVERSLEMVVALLAILKAGAVYVPLDAKQGK